MGHPYNYAAEKFAAARRTLMLPRPDGEARSVAGAYLECMLGLRGIQQNQLDESAAGWVQTLTRLMDPAGIVDPKGEGTAQIKAAKLSQEERSEFSNAVDELAHWFARRSREEK